MLDYLLDLIGLPALLVPPLLCIALYDVIRSMPDRWVLTVVFLAFPYLESL
jgi:hypothetical protein